MAEYKIPSLVTSPPLKDSKILLYKCESRKDDHGPFSPRCRQSIGKKRGLSPWQKQETNRTNYTSVLKATRKRVWHKGTYLISVFLDLFYFLFRLLYSYYSSLEFQKSLTLRVVPKTTIKQILLEPEKFWHYNNHFVLDYRLCLVILVLFVCHLRVDRHPQIVSSCVQSLGFLLYLV